MTIFGWYGANKLSLWTNGFHLICFVKSFWIGCVCVWADKVLWFTFWQISKTRKIKVLTHSIFFVIFFICIKDEEKKKSQQSSLNAYTHALNLLMSNNRNLMVFFSLVFCSDRPRSRSRERGGGGGGGGGRRDRSYSRGRRSLSRSRSRFVFGSTIEKK